MIFDSREQNPVVKTEKYPYFHFQWIIKDILASSMRPGNCKDIELILENRVRSIVCLKENPHMKEEWERLKINYFHIPVKDFSIPEESQLEEFFKIVDENFPVLVHCHAGLGRTGVFTAAYLIRCLGFENKEAIDIVRRLRPGSVETKEQERFLNSLLKSRINYSEKIKKEIMKIKKL